MALNGAGIDGCSTGIRGGATRVSGVGGGGTSWFPKEIGGVCVMCVGDAGRGFDVNFCSEFTGLGIGFSGWNGTARAAV